MPSPACPRQLLARIVANLELASGMRVLSGVEFEFCLLKESSTSVSGPPHRMDLLFRQEPISYSTLELSLHETFANSLLKACQSFDCPVESFHTEMGGAAAEAALSVAGCREAADRAILFRLVAKVVGNSMIPRPIRPTFMAKPFVEEAGNSGHIHC